MEITSSEKGIAAMDNFDGYLEKHFVDPHGVIYTFIDAATLKPADDAFYEPYAKIKPTLFNSPCHWGPDNFTPAELGMYENCGMTTGAYLNSLCSALRTPGSGTEEIRKRAKRSFDALVYIYNIGQTLEKGFFPKIWGDRLSHQTSTDQCLYTVHSMHNYYPFASEADREKIAEIIIGIAEFWQRRKYVLTYFDRVNMVWPPLRFPPLLMLAYRYSGKEAFRKEALRILNEHRDIVPEYLVRNGYLYCSADHIAMDTMNFELMVDFAPLPEEWFEKLYSGLRKEWGQYRKSLTEDGFFWINMYYDQKTETAVPREKECPRSAWSTMIVRAGLQLSRLIPEIYPDARKAAELVLNKLAPEKMYYYHPDDKEQLDPERRYRMLFLSGDAISNRQWAYRLLREYDAKGHIDGGY
jgi:hypothetical protein